MKPPETRYVRTSDGVHVAYQVIGTGPIDFLWIPGFVSHLELVWEHPPMARFLRRLTSFSRLIMFDKRGTGLSDRVAPDYYPDLETRMIDVLAVMDAVESPRAVIFGLSEGGAMAQMFAATYPERTAALIVCGGTPRSAWAPDFPWGETDDELEAEIADALQRWGTTEWAADKVREWYAPSQADNPAEIDFFARLVRMGASPGAGETVWRMNHEIDVRAILPSIQVPTMIIDREGDVVVPPDGYAAKLIPGARSVILAGQDHAPYAGDAEAVLRAIESFVDDVRTEEGELSRVLATVMFTDIVGSTGKAAELGDDAWRVLVERHHAIVRSMLGRFRGVEVDTAGDGFFATFDGPARAIRCAQAIEEAVRPLGVEVRAGLHTGECGLIDGKIGGLAVVIGARVGAMAGPSEVLVSQTVKDLVAGSGVRFEDAGEHELKGVPDRWRLFRVSPA